MDLTTGTPGQARATAARVAELGARHLDGAILAVPRAIGTAQATLFFSGSAAAHEEHDTGDYTTDVFTVAVNATAITRLVEASRDAGIGATVLASIQALLDRRLADGHGAGSLAGLVELIRRPQRAAA